MARLGNIFVCCPLEVIAPGAITDSGDMSERASDILVQFRYSNDQLAVDVGRQHRHVDYVEAAVDRFTGKESAS